MADNDSDKSHDPTPHRRQQVRERGQVAQSQDLVSAGLLLGGLIVLAISGRQLLDLLGRLFVDQLGSNAWITGDAQLAVTTWHHLVIGLASTLLPILAASMALAISLNVLQVGIRFRADRIAPDLSRLNPLKGLTRIFSQANLIRLTLGIFKIGLVGAIVLWSLLGRREELLKLAAYDIPQLSWYVWDFGFWVCIKVGVALLVLAIVDYGYQWWRHEQDLRMTPQELREEMRNQQGDPQLANRRRNLQREFATQGVARAAAKADVILTSGRGLSVALHFDPQTMTAPLVVAKGAGAISARIRQLALEHGVPIIEDKSLAQALHREVAMNRAVPEKRFAAVVAVLAQIRDLKQSNSRQALSRTCTTSSQ